MRNSQRPSLACTCVYARAFRAHKRVQRKSQTTVTAALLVGLTFFWFTPMLFVTGFTSAATLRRAFPGLDSTFGEGSTVLVSGWLSTIIFQTFLSVLPYAFNWAAFYKASMTLSEVERFMFATYFAFLVVYLL